MSTQPEALRLADVLEALNDSKKLAVSSAHGQTLGAEAYRIALSGFSAGELLDAAAELRRLHAVNAELLEALRNLARMSEAVAGVMKERARAAIAKAEGVKP